MKINRYALIDEKVQEQPLPADLLAGHSGRLGESWYDVIESGVLLPKRHPFCTGHG